MNCKTVSSRLTHIVLLGDCSKNLEIRRVFFFGSLCIISYSIYYFVLVHSYFRAIIVSISIAIRTIGSTVRRFTYTNARIILCAAFTVFTVFIIVICFFLSTDECRCYFCTQCFPCTRVYICGLCLVASFPT